MKYLELKQRQQKEVNEFPFGFAFNNQIQGIAFINDEGNIDAVMNIDGEGLLLSEMQDVGIIQNCGWFKNLFKKVVKVVVVAAAVVAVAAGISLAATAVASIDFEGVKYELKE